MAANITSGNLQSYDPGHGIRIFQGLKPDIVLIQEFNYGNNSDASIRRFVNTTFGTEFTYARENGAQIPNGVISRWPITEKGVWEDDASPNREFVWARIDIPGENDLWAISVHLLTNKAKRPGEASQLVRYVEAKVRASDFLVIGGDFRSSSG
jgi:endonuclease/exonuclease/phosphatase family metal-dependent hydrolase